jgi:hypothetical protein
VIWLQKWINPPNVYEKGEINNWKLPEIVMIFSKRHKDSIKKTTLVIHINEKTRIRLLRCLRKFDFIEWNTTDTGYNYEISAISDLLIPKLLDEQGWEYLHVSFSAIDGKKDIDIDGFINDSAPYYILDILELYHAILSDHKENIQSFQQEINRIFTEEKYTWQLLNGKIFKIDSSYLDEELLSETHALLHTHGFEGALDEFEQARNHYENERYRDALTYANHAFESTLKIILGEKFKTKKTGELIKGLLNSQFIPPYLSNQLKSFNELLQIPPTIRNNSGGHGSG